MFAFDVFFFMFRNILLVFTCRLIIGVKVQSIGVELALSFALNSKYLSFEFNFSNLDGDIVADSSESESLSPRWSKAFYFRRLYVLYVDHVL